MKTLHGIAASPGAAAAPAYLYLPDAYQVPDRWTDLPEKAVAELGTALDGIAASLTASATSTTGEASEILRAQAAIAADPALRRAAAGAIAEGIHPARAVLSAGEEFAATLEGSGNEYAAARGPDVRHICDLAARALLGVPQRRPPHPLEPCVVVADDLMPTDTVGLDATLVRALVTAHGSRTSHTSVIARALGIPAVVGVRGIVEAAVDAHDVGVNGTTGEVVLDPDDATLGALEAARREHRSRRERLRFASGSGPVLTADGAHIEVAANISGVEELSAALADGAEGVGLLRTELLYKGRRTPPSEEEQVTLLRDIRRLLGARRLVVRTFDIGADKHVPFLPVRPERNPELGVRGLRLAQLHPDLLDTQLRAIAATAALGPTAVMAPMVATVEEARWFVDRVSANGVPASVEVGVMVEVPALALMTDRLAAHVDFVSIGTNDLAQYLFAADRRDEVMSGLLDPFTPALLRAVAVVCRGADGQAWVGVCGEAASDPAWAVLAVGLGVTELSMQGVAVPEVRAALKAVTLDRCREAARAALDAADAAEARTIGSDLVKEPS
jgi:phosphotransferase system enzyme I (PtsI)